MKYVFPYDRIIYEIISMFSLTVKKVVTLICMKYFCDVSLYQVAYAYRDIAVTM